MASKDTVLIILPRNRVCFVFFFFYINTGMAGKKVESCKDSHLICTLSDVQF